ncbi:MAG: flagellin [Arcobacteraceae bacterium]|jgi:hypothetical protein|nr:flagellin [Arcobacteraceae bacterium]
MQLGRLEIMDQSKVEHVEKLSKIASVDKEHTIQPDEQYKNADNQLKAKDQKEVLLDNVKFGFDTESKEFFVRVSKEGVDYQFPTDQIMRLKAHLQESLDNELQKN